MPYLDELTIINNEHLLSFYTEKLKSIFKNKYLEELTLQMKFYRMQSITSFINSRLRILNIGNLDLYTFIVLCNHICKYKFCKISCLQELTIGLNGNIDELKEFENLKKIVGASKQTKKAALTEQQQKRGCCT